MAIFDVPQRFSQNWVHDKMPTMDSTEFHAMFHEAATRGWDEDELRQLAGMWAAESGAPDGQLANRADDPRLAVSLVGHAPRPGPSL